MMRTVLFLSVFLLLSICGHAVNPWELPVLPANPPNKNLGGNTSYNGKLIPRILWMAIRDFKEGLNVQLPALFNRNPGWNIQICTNDMKDAFMNATFAGTSLLWAYNMISPLAGAAKADIWRYAVLWTYGGVYIDDDSDMMTPLDQVVEPTDTCIVSYEKNGFNANRCFIPRYHLSDYSAFRPYHENKAPSIFHGRILLNWAIMFAPRHILLEEMMKNAVEIIKHEYFQDKVLRALNAAYRWEVIMCTTGPSLLTATARELVLRNVSNFQYRLAGNDFRPYGGKFKAIHTPVRNDPHHYMHVMAHDKSHKTLLKEYLPEPEVTSDMLKEWQGQCIQGQNGKEIFVIDKGTRRGIPNFDTFVALNFTLADVIVISDTRLSLIPLGDSMPKMTPP